jgi:hypothetical protein
MSFPYNQQLLDNALTYNAYLQGIDDLIATEPADEAAQKMRHYIGKNALLMAQYDKTYKTSDGLKAALTAAPATAWLVITEGWCGDAAFNVPMLAAVERAFPDKISLHLFLRDSNLELMDANLTEGGRSIPKLVVLSNDFKELGNWGPRPAGLQTLMKSWKNEGLHIKEIIPRVHEWYDNDATRSVQEELTEMIKSYSEATKYKNLL